MLDIGDLERELDLLHLEGHWRLTGVTQPSPSPVAAPYLWKWRDVRRVLTNAGELREIEGGASRRTVRLCTPGLPIKWTTPTIHTSVQLVKPGEIAEAHRHSMGALRFVIEGSGGYTNVDGDKLHMEPGDMILTPQGTWHDHGHEGTEAMMWIDGHDFPFVHHLNALFFEGFPQRQQRIARDVTSSHPYVFKGREMLARLRSLGDEAYDPRFGTVLEYLDPATGASMLPTMACRLQRLRPAKPTQLFRQTANAIYHAVAGSGTTTAGDVELAWNEGDVFVVPGWTWHQHAAQTDDAVLLCISDEPIQAAFSLLRTETR